MGFSKHTKTCFGKKFFSFLAYEKYIFYHFKIFSTKKWLIWSKYVFSNWNTFQTKCNKGFFLYVNLRTRFFEGQKSQSPQK